MKRTLVPIALAAFVLALALAPAGAAPRPKTVRVADNEFVPDFLKVRQGTMVRFNWVGEQNHNVISSGGSPGRVFTSGNPETGDGILYKHRFRKAGRYTLICQVHVPDMKMILKVKRKRRG